MTVVALIRSASPALKSSGSGRLLVAITRTSTDWLPLRPTGRTSPVARTRSSRSCVSAGKASISSSSSVPPSASTSLPILARECAREGAFFVAEQFAVDDVGGDRLAVDRQQRPLGAQAGGVNAPGDRFLAGAGLADDQDRKPVARGLGGDRQRGPEFGRCADQLLELHRRSQLFRHGRKLARAAAAVGIGGERFEQAFGGDRADEEIGGAGAHRFDRVGNRVGMAKHDHRQRVALRVQRGDEPGPGLAIPGAEQGGLDLAAVRTLKQGHGGLGIGGADRAPSGTRGDRTRSSRRSSASRANSNRDRVRSSAIPHSFEGPSLAAEE